MNFITKLLTSKILLLSLLLSNNTNAQCHYVIDMQDSFGDGWNGASVEVDINGVYTTDFTFTNGNNSSDSILTISGDIVEFNFVSGNWDSEITFQVYDPSGLQILDEGPFTNNQGNDAFLITDTSSSICFPQIVNVTFQVDMNNVTTPFTSPEINGSWNAFCGNCDALSDPDGDNVWEKTIPLYTGVYDFIFSADSLSMQETIDPNILCSNGSTVLPRRYINVGTQDIILPVVCWESCNACNGFPQPPTGISCNTGNVGTVFTDDCDAQGSWNGDFDNNNGYWQVGNGGTGSGGTGPSGAHSGANYFYFEASAGGLNSATIITPAIDLSNCNDDAELTFWMHGRGPGMGIFEVSVANDTNGPFNTVYSQFGETHTDANDPWTQIGINVGSFVGQTLYVAFTLDRDPQANPYYQSDLAIDQIEVTSCVTCPSPNTLAINNVTSTSADLDWTPSGNETQWEIIYNGISQITSVIPTTINNLSPNNLYNCTVRAICGLGDTSSQSTSVNFYTSCGFSVAPTIENFDIGFSPCWSQDQINDDFDWTLNDGDTPSGGTGPDDDVSIGGNYMYTEASNPRNDGDFAIMYTEQIDLSTLSNPQLNFFYHMYGSAIGELQIDMYDGNSYINIFNIVGDQGDLWIEENIVLNSSSNIVSFRITGILGEDANGDTWPGDIAVDEFSISNAMSNDIEVYSGGARSDCNLTSQEQITVDIVNNGVLPQNNFDVSYEINGANPVIETFGATINYGDTLTYYFSTKADLSSDGLYNIEFESFLSNDQEQSNNNSSVIEENYFSPNPPLTLNDTICIGDTTTLMASSIIGQITWYSDSNAINNLSNTTVSPTANTTYYAGVQAGEFFIDDFESYSSGLLIAQSSPNWTTPTGGGGQDDALVSSTQASGGNNSVYLNQINDDDLYLPFDQVYNSGEIEIAFDLFVNTNANINLQPLTSPSLQQLFELRFSPSGLMEFDIGTTNLLGYYPANNWCNVKITGDLNTSIWNVFIDGVFQGGAVIPIGNEVGLVNFKPEIGGEFYIDNVEWYAKSENDCFSLLSPLNIIVENCSFISEKDNISIELYPNPTSGEININSTSIIKGIKITDYQGKVVFSKEKINSITEIINISELEKSIYFIKINTEKGSQIKKIISQ